MAKYRITSPDGAAFEVTAPDGASMDEVRDFAQRSWSQKPAEPTDRQRLLSSAPMRVAKGMKDPVDGAAQLVQRILPNGVVNAVNKAADAIGGEGTFLGDVLGIRGMTPQQLDADIKGSNAEYEAARKATGQEGADLLRLAGNVMSPVNAPIARVVPVGKAGATVMNLAGKGAVSGGAGAAVQPVMGDDFASEKAGQVAMGAVGGAVLAPVVSKVVNSVGKVVQRYQQLGSVNVTPEGLRLRITKQLAEDGVDPASIPDQVFQRLSADVRSALAKGKNIDPTALVRQQDFDALGIPALQGQLTRNPGQWQREFNLSGVEGVGEPLAAVQQQQARGIQAKLDKPSLDAFQAGERLIQLARTQQDKRDLGVKQAYDAFRQSTGRDLDVPLQGLAQDYAAALNEFGDAIPAAVRKKFEGLGLLTGKQLKGLSIEDAESLIKTINRNTDMKDTVAARGLGDLRKAVQNAITAAAEGDTAGTGAAELARTARAAAAANFRNLEATPALQAAVDGVEPDRFVQRYVIGGNVNEIKRFAKDIGPEGREIMASQLTEHLRHKAFGANAAGDGKSAQAAFNNELRTIGRQKLEAILGKQGAEEMYRIGRVLAYIKQVPEGATPNTSGTGQMLTSILGQARGIRGLPFVNDWIVQPIGKFGQRQEVQRSLSGAPTTPVELDPKTAEALAKLFAPAPVGAGAALGYSVR